MLEFRAGQRTGTVFPVGQVADRVIEIADWMGRRVASGKFGL
jgi:hypothetical protein